MWPSFTNHLKDLSFFQSACVNMGFLKRRIDNTTPSDQTSAFSVLYTLPSLISGEFYMNVPTWKSLCSGSSWVANPKSHMRRLKLLSTKMFSVFRSRCDQPWRLRCRSASTNCLNMILHAFSENAPAWKRKLNSSPLSIYSCKIYGKNWVLLEVTTLPWMLNLRTEARLSCALMCIVWHSLSNMRISFLFMRCLVLRNSFSA